MGTVPSMMNGYQIALKLMIVAHNVPGVAGVASNAVRDLEQQTTLRLKSI
jgi:hypothetical protein